MGRILLAALDDASLQDYLDHADLQTKTFEIMQDVTVNKQKTADKAFNACDAYIRG